MPLIGGAERETLLILHVDRDCRLMESELHTIGAAENSAVYPREVLRSAILKGSAGIILCHNHPSGSACPSEDDFQMTRDLVASGLKAGVSVLDHVIVTQDPDEWSYAGPSVILAMREAEFQGLPRLSMRQFFEVMEKGALNPGLGNHGGSSAINDPGKRRKYPVNIGSSSPSGSIWFFAWRWTPPSLSY